MRRYMRLTWCFPAHIRGPVDGGVEEIDEDEDVDEEAQEEGAEEAEEEEEEEEEKAQPWAGLKTLPVRSTDAWLDCMRALATHVKCSHRSGCMHGGSAADPCCPCNPLLQERNDVLALLEELKASGKKQLTVLLLGELCDA